MFFRQVFEPKLAQYAYIVGCQRTGEAIVIDPMRDIDVYEAIAASENLKIVAATETHIHADFVSGLREFAAKGVKVYASDEGTSDWKYEYLKNSDYNYEFLYHGSEIKIGNIRIKAIHTPGHTPEHICFSITDGAAADEPMGIATGDFVFVGDVGRPDLLESAAGYKGAMEPSARTLYRSLLEFRNLPEYMQVWPGHGAGSACGKSLGAVPESTVGYELRFNTALKAMTSEQIFVDFILDGQPEPPLYFARMKRWNKIGPPLLAAERTPRRLSIDAFKKAIHEKSTTIVDTRPISDFMKGHVPGSFSVVFDNGFNTVAGSYLAEDASVLLIINETDVDAARRDLERVGIDGFHSFVTPEDLEAYVAQGGKMVATPSITFNDLDRFNGESVILDVRKKVEYDQKHLEGAINAVHVRLPELLDKIPSDRKLLVHCQSGKRASYAVSYLESRGYDVVYINDTFL